MTYRKQRFIEESVADVLCVPIQAKDRWPQSVLHIPVVLRIRTTAEKNLNFWNFVAGVRVLSEVKGR